MGRSITPSMSRHGSSRLWPAAALAALLAWPSPIPAAQDVYRWTDDRGAVHYAQRLHDVPEAFRARAERLNARTLTPLPPPPPGTTGTEGLLRRLGQSASVLPAVRVELVVDGDSIHVRVGDRTEKVRYIGINAPELNHPERGEEPWAREATEVNRKLVEGKVVRLERDVQERDSYGRLLAYVYVGDVMVNAELVRLGYAQSMTIPPNVKHRDLLRSLERRARARKLGLWGGGVLTPPRTEPHPAATAPAGLDADDVAPARNGSCPGSHPIKGNFTTWSGERCIFHTAGGEFYDQTRAERCYASATAAAQDGCRASLR